MRVPASRSRRQFVQSALGIGVLGTGALTGTSLSAFAQSSQPRILVGFPAGGTVDVVARRLAEKLKSSYMDNIIVDSKPGAGGRIAIEALKTALPDGSASVLTPSSMIVVYPHVYPKLSYNPAQDLQPVTTVCANALAFVVGPGVPDSVKTLADFIAWAKSSGKAAYATPAAGSILHFLGIVFRNKAGIELTHAPYRGMAPAIQDLLGGNVPSCLGTLGDFLPHLAGGKLRPLAVTSPQRSRFMPNVPTFAEAGYKEATGMDWFGLFLPAKTPQAMVTKLAATTQAALKDPAITEALDKLGFEPLNLSTAEFAARIKQETAFWQPIVKASGFTAED
jgi:tripartite-type tricarboxylate transporter receptor subunit TctC